MQAFTFLRATDARQAIDAGAHSPTAQQGASVRFVAGGTTLLDLMKLNVETPAQVVDINRLPLAKVERTPDGGLKIGALAQLRNMATTGGNLLQRTRCMYFRDEHMPCNKREPGSGCPAIDGANRSLAILGTSEHCIATNPSDMNVALAALEARIVIQGAQGERTVPIADFFLLPGVTPQYETVMQPGDLITHVLLPPPKNGARSHYLKLRDRASYEFALASAAVVLAAEDGRITHARVALGGVGTRPWRSLEAEQALVGQDAGPDAFAAAANAALRDAKPQSENAFKVELAKRCLTHALATVAAA
ncbi:MAG: FAD-binding molybdopterin dehydrogenase [Rhodanobacter sp. SCN 68-63]|nr:MAG: FAD-binding molybdopterin dehydrogenase [Rhodanobacter sp. SCN 68-63]